MPPSTPGPAPPPLVLLSPTPVRRGQPSPIPTAGLWAPLWVPAQAFACVSAGDNEGSFAVTHRGAAAGESWGWSCCGLTRPSVGAGLALAGVDLLLAPLACGGGGTRCHTVWSLPPFCSFVGVGPALAAQVRAPGHALWKDDGLPCGRGYLVSTASSAVPHACAHPTQPRLTRVPGQTLTVEGVG